MGADSHLAKCSVILEHAASTAGDPQPWSCAAFGDGQRQIFPNDWESEGIKPSKVLYKHGTGSSSSSFEVHSRARERAELPPLQEAVPCLSCVGKQRCNPCSGWSQQGFLKLVSHTMGFGLCSKELVWAVQCSSFLFYYLRNFLQNRIHRNTPGELTRRSCYVE